MSNFVSSSLNIKAKAEDIFDILADPRKHSEFDGSGSVVGSIEAPEELELGSKFSMNLKMGVPYRITNTVIEFVENEKIAWQHLGKHIWRYELKENEDGTTTVTETWDWGTCPLLVGKGLELSGFPKRNLENIKKTLENLKSLLETL